MIVMVITFVHAKGRIVALHHTLMMSPLPRISDYLENSLAVFMPPGVLGDMTTFPLCRFGQSIIFNPSLDKCDQLEGSKSQALWAWWYEINSNQMLALCCVKYNGTFDQVFARYQQRLRTA